MLRPAAGVLHPAPSAALLHSAARSPLLHAAAGPAAADSALL
ncbi:MAG: hypothetical protein Q8N10_07370 [Phenylobacterium sp.]|uniref:Uncharacterized protein n=1 Tax=Phenylobacterium ferrooxidans TaxID=2982689 RepID=A0ABW6CLU0_9CAUL|nr:hypothetical protein [Phenylobacterium sp.]MDO8321860.1 hypothetical protein [Phenylobacterium sp.]MDO8913562.1 hypothetical protein [Phenylobacterium sp.]MDP3100302.1 hypothetical protein [Phenylobacterium sp.]